MSDRRENIRAHRKFTNPLDALREQRTMPAHRSIAFAICMFIAMSFAACDLFETREAEQPNQSGSTFIPPTSADLVLTNLRTAITERNTNNYLRCFVDTLHSSRQFVFHPTSSALSRYPALFSRWNLQSERAYFESIRALMSKDDASSLSFQGSFQLIASDSAVYNADYQLTFQHHVSGIPETVYGNVQFLFGTDRNKTWSIIDWIDTNNGAPTSWSELKGRFGN